MLQLQACGHLRLYSTRTRKKKHLFGLRRGDVMTDTHTVGSVTYKKVDEGYFEKRGLRRYAKVWSLWALGVGAVISGHYSGWNFGLANGFGAMLIALLIIAAMYWGLIFSLAGMSPALPHTG